ncbi:MAG TPA: SRPBCC domain-containing protein [Thermomicrobiales bacterium]|nr:SRPBCC domain-containing protein [Thermomicrobiales bacterium]
MTDQLPEHPVEATLHADNTRWTLHMTRELDQAPEVVWAAITHADQVPRWGPFAPEHDLDIPGELGLPVIGDPESTSETSRGIVTEVTPPTALGVLWGTDPLRVELWPADTGTTLHLTHTFDGREAASSYAAGWHLCLAALDGVLDGLDLPSVVGPAAMEHGWPELNQQYAALFAARDGSPERMASL